MFNYRTSKMAAPKIASKNDRRQPPITVPALPASPRQDEKVPVHLERLAETARDYARGAKAAATQRAYAADWRHYTAWCRRKELEPLPPDPQVVGLYLAASASEPSAPGRKPNAVRTIERRLSAIAWNCAQRGQPLDGADRHIAEVMSGIRRRHARPPDQKEAVLAEDLMRMVATLDHGLRGLRDRAILLIGFAGGLRRSEIGPDHTEEGAGWIEFLDQGLLIRVRGKTGWREVEIGRGSKRCGRRGPGGGNGGASRGGKHESP
jgi:hypothetical protein